MKDRWHESTGLGGLANQRTHDRKISPVQCLLQEPGTLSQGRTSTGADGTFEDTGDHIFEWDAKFFEKTRRTLKAVVFVSAAENTATKCSTHRTHRIPVLPQATAKKARERLAWRNDGTTVIGRAIWEALLA